MEVAIIIVALMGWFGWKRYLRLKEAELMLSKGGDSAREVEERWRREAEAGEVWRTRWGLLAGITLAVIGLAMALIGNVNVERIHEKFLYSVLGCSAALVGAIIAAAHAIWARQRSKGCDNRSPEKPE